MAIDLHSNKPYTAAVQRIEKLLAQFRDVRPITYLDLSEYKDRFTQGWEIPGLCTPSNYKLHLLISREFPYSPPRIAVRPKPPILSWPHLEGNGFLCLMSEHSSHSFEDVESVVLRLLHDAKELVTTSVSGRNMQDFEDEFQNYWIYWGKTVGTISSLCRPEGPSRWVSSWHGKSITLIGEDKSTLLKWLINRYGQTDISKLQIQSIPLLWLPRPLRPNEYPESIGKLLSVLKEMQVDESMLIQFIMDEGMQHKTMLLGFGSKYGFGFAGLRINKPPKSIKNGYRRMLPDDVLLARSKGISISGTMVTRLDEGWIHGRDHNPLAHVLAKKSVIIFGIGSLGSTVAELFTQSDVGKITLVDPEIVESANICRHTLGVPAIGKNKALELSRLLASNFPHIEIEGVGKSCEEFANTMSERLTAADLIISTIGSLSKESILNARAQEVEGYPPILYGWLEPHAAAGHAAVFFKGHGCLRCLMDDYGRIKIPVTFWPGNSTLQSVPACGGHFQPYGAIELSHIHGLVADLALDILLGKVTTSAHRIWFGRKKLFEDAGGAWNIEWITRYGDPGYGGAISEVDLAATPDCPGCGDTV